MDKEGQQKIVFITKDYFPISNGTINAIDNILSRLSKFYHVIVISQKKGRNENSNYYINGYQVFKINNKIDKVAFYFEDKIIDLKKSYSFIVKIKLLFVRTLYKLVRFLLGNKMVFHNWEKQGERIIFNSKLISSEDIIVTVGAPFDNLKLLSKLRENLKNSSIAIFFDLYVNNPTYSLTENIKNNYKKRLQEEAQWYNDVDWIIALPEYEKNIDESLKQQFNKKIKYIHLPSMNTEIKNFNVPNVFKKNNERIDLVYAGLFYEDFRNPKDMFLLFSQLFLIDDRLHLHILGHGCEHLIKEFIEKFPNKVSFYGRRTKEESYSALYKADILINLENTINTQIPSKIYEMISFRKPIINFYHSGYENCKRILKNFELSISFELSGRLHQEKINEILNFVNNSIGLKIEKEVLLKNYYNHTPDYFVDQLIKLIRK